MANKCTNNEYNSDQNAPILSDESKARAESLMDFISDIKENSAYNMDLDDNNLEEIILKKSKDNTAANPLSQQIDAVENINGDNTNKTKAKTLTALEKEPAVETTAVKPALSIKNEYTIDTSTVLFSEQNSVENNTAYGEKQAEQMESSAFFEQDKAEDIITEQMLNNAESAFNEEAFNSGFNPSFAFYDDTATTKQSTSIEIREEIASQNKIFKRVKPVTALNSWEDKLTTKPSEKHGMKSWLSDVSNKIKRQLTSDSDTITDKHEIQESKSLTQATDAKHEIKTPRKIANKKAFFSNVPKKTASAIIAAVFIIGVLITGGVMAAKGLIPAFASDDIYGIFVDGKLVAATNQEGKIEEAIDDFLAGYKYIEEQGSLTNLRLSSPYEIRQLTREEIKASVNTDVLTTRAETKSDSTSKTTAHSTDDQSAQTTDPSAAQTTEQTTVETDFELTTAVQTDSNGNTTHATAIQANPVNKLDNKITVSQNIDELKTVLFYGIEPTKYSVVEGDNLYKIAKRENLTLTELMVPNPDLLEDSTIGIDQEILIVKMSGPLKLSFSREVTVTEDIAYKTIEEKTDDLYEGETKVTQQGKEGIRQEVTKYDYENSVIAVKTPISDETIEEPVNKIIKVGTKKKTSADQNSGLTDSGSSSSSSDSSFMWPVSGARLSSKFGPRTAPKRGASSYHRGIDLAISSGTPIYASRSGTVTISSYVGGYGNLVEINHGGGMTTRYGHCKTLKVQKGQKVQKGDIIALVGNTGVSTGPHLHFEIRKNGTAINPLNYLS